MVPYSDSELFQMRREPHREGNDRKRGIHVAAGTKHRRAGDEQNGWLEQRAVTIDHAFARRRTMRVVPM